MRKLTRDQIIDIFGLNNQFDSITIYINKVDIKLRKGYSYLFQQNLSEEHKNIVLKWHKRELERLPDEARQHVEYLTCHPTVIAEISFPESTKSITDGLIPGIGTDQKFKDGYFEALIDVRSKENMDGNKMPLGNAGLGGGIASEKPPSGGW